MKFSIMTSPRYYDVTHVKLEIKDISSWEFFDFRNIYWENYDLLLKLRL